jgi:hypothetical protein
MGWRYSCPHCSGILNPDKTVILVGMQRDTRILMGFHPKPGSYKISLPPGFEVEPGASWEFYCPLCHESIESEEAPDLCRLDMVSQQVRHRVYFSRVAGEHATFVISAEGIESHGEHAKRHSLNLLGHV